jgi:alpha-L-arabinofuranosidase
LIVQHDDGENALLSGTVGLRPWQREARFRKLWVRTGSNPASLPFQTDIENRPEVSGPWRAVQRGTAQGQWALSAERPFTGRQSQQVSFVSSQGEIGVENQGLNRWGLCLVEGRLYEGYVWARAVSPAEICVALESRDGAQTYAEWPLRVPGSTWQRLEFGLTPGRADAQARFVIKLRQVGSVVLGHAHLQPAAWGRFHGLPLRRDVTEGLVDQGLTVLRYGGSMVNAPEYRWKKMIGPRDRRPPYKGTWYPHSSNGWGILDFLDLCEAAGFLGIPAFNMDETPQDLADFIQYVNGPADSEWGRRRVAAGHPEPYNLRHLELGNEERVDETYFRKFQALAEAIWARDDRIILVVGDFVYGQPISDPFKFRGAASGITSLAAHQKILELARRRDREVWFDIHIWTGDPFKLDELRVVPTYVRALEQIAGGARHKVAIFELNANNHDQRRALANAWTLTALQSMADRLPVICSANCLQPDGQNDNGWNQGLLFLDPCRVWLQPPGHVTRMLARHRQPLAVPCELRGPETTLLAAATRGTKGTPLVLQVVNLSSNPQPAELSLDGFTPKEAEAVVIELASPLEAANTAAAPDRLTPKRTPWRHTLAQGRTRYSFTPFSFTLLEFR